jgi:beta-1,4-mannosyltransferase
MQYHALSLIARDVRVSLVGYTGAPCIDTLATSPLVSMHTFAPPLERWKTLRKKLYLVFALAKAVLLLLQLLATLIFSVDRPDVILVQNPPALPTLLCVWLACRLRGASMVVDWHNLGYSMLRYKATHPVAALFKVMHLQAHITQAISIISDGAVDSRGAFTWAVVPRYNHDILLLCDICAYIQRLEAFFGRRADAAFCVSKAMAQWLQLNFRVQATVLYDKPPAHFSADISTAAKHDLFNRLADDVKAVYDKHGVHSANENPFTTALPSANDSEQLCIYRSTRPALLVSSTSWTPDEDFGLLLDALILLDSALAASTTAAATAAQHPGVVVIVTGKGPLKAHYEGRMQQLSLQYISVATLWLENADYPVLLSAADLGICLHTSTSGLDLPMKVVDMLGSGLPVCAVKYNCIGELVHTAADSNSSSSSSSSSESTTANGCLFETSEQLCNLLVQLLQGFGNGTEALRQLTNNASAIGTWEDNWSAVAWPVMQPLLSQSRSSKALPLLAAVVCTAVATAAAAASR